MCAWFFERLFDDDEFCAALGRVALAASELESNIRQYLERNDVAEVDKKATLGRLVGLLRDHELVGANYRMHFAQMTLQRNYLIHKLFDLYADRIEETLLPRDVSEGDVGLFRERASTLAQDLLFFSRQLEQAGIDT